MVPHEALLWTDGGGYGEIKPRVMGLLRDGHHSIELWREVDIDMGPEDVGTALASGIVNTTPAAEPHPTAANVVLSVSSEFVRDSFCTAYLIRWNSGTTDRLERLVDSVESAANEIARLLVLSSVFNVELWRQVVLHFDVSIYEMPPASRNLRALVNANRASVLRRLRDREEVENT